ncbi:MAG: alpha/beta hydrolase [Fidelibacterota bacterium]|nr:MAG: alpha/beta hydrolase [Candidatus Neomarinimicrobiota bacterium]
MRHRQLIVITIGLVFIIAGCKSIPDNTAMSSDDVPIRFDVYGKGQPALVFVHGWCGDRTNWDHILDPYAKRSKVVTIDLPGFGESGRERDTWTMGAYGEDVMEVVKRLKLNQVILIGFSMGDKVIVEAARRMPERVVALVGIDNFRNIDPLSAEQIEQVVAILSASFKGEEAMRRFLRGAIHPSRDSVFVDSLASQMGGCPSTSEIAIPIIEAYYLHDLKPALEEITAPIRAINSDILPTDIKILQRFDPSFRVINYSGAGHLILWEDPDQLVRHLSEILTEFTGSSTAQ